MSGDVRRLRLPPAFPRGKPSAEFQRRRRDTQAPRSLPQEVLLDKRELERVQTYLRKTFQNPAFRVVARPRKDDSAEVYLGEEFMGVLFRDDEDGDLSYNFSMAILETDLEG